MGVPIFAEQFICAIHPRDFSVPKGRFTSVAFQPSDDGSGISVIHCECAIQTSGSICEHLERFYANQTKTPGIYWPIPGSLPDGCLACPEVSTTGDECHHNIINLDRKEARAFFNTNALDTFRICGDDGPVTVEKIKQLFAIY